MWPASKKGGKYPSASGRAQKSAVNKAPKLELGTRRKSSNSTQEYSESGLAKISGGELKTGYSRNAQVDTSSGTGTG